MIIEEVNDLLEETNRINKELEEKKKEEKTEEIEEFSTPAATVSYMQQFMFI